MIDYCLIATHWHLFTHDDDEDDDVNDYDDDGSIIGFLIYVQLEI